MRNIFLIDFENVGSDGLSGILNLNPEDRVIIFYSTNSNRLTMRAHILIGRAQAQFTYYEATVGGKNALDHQLSTYLGYLIGTNAADRYYIVSRDNGYRYASNFWNGMLKQTVVFCIDTIKNAQKITEKVLGKAQEEPTLRTAEDLRNDDLEEGTGEPMDETEALPETSEASAAAPAAEPPAPAPEAPASAPEAASVPAEPIPEDAQPADAPSAAEQSDSEAAAAETPVAQEPASTQEPALPEAAEPKAADEPQTLSPLPEPALPAAPIPEASASETTAAVPAAAVPAAPVSAEAPAQEAPAQPMQAAATVALTVPAILFPEQEFDDVPEPGHEQNRGRANNRRGRKPNGAGQNRYSRNTRQKQAQNQPQTQPQNPSHSEEPKAQERPAEKAQGEKSAQFHGGNRQRSDSRPEHKAESRQEHRPEARPEKKPEARPEAKAETKPALRQDTQSEHRPEGQAAADWLTAMLAPYPKLSEEKIREMIAGHKKQILCNSLRKQLGQERGLALYGEIKKAAWK